MSYTHFTLEERKYLQQLLSEGKSFREIARILERSPSSISREVKRNKSKWKPHRKSDNPFRYNHWRAQNLYTRRRRKKVRQAPVPGSEEWNNVICQILKGLPIKSISLDNGSEFAEFRALEEELGAPVYFAEPHKPWQRGTNENTNDLLRFFFPKGFDFRTITQSVVDEVVNLINNRPRKCLGWRTPAEVFFEECVALG